MKTGLMWAYIAKLPDNKRFSYLNSLKIRLGNCNFELIQLKWINAQFEHACLCTVSISWVYNKERLATDVSGVTSIFIAQAWPVLWWILWTFMVLFPKRTPCKVPTWRLAVRQGFQLNKQHHDCTTSTQSVRCNSARNRSEITLPAVLPRPPTGTDRCPRVVSTLVRPQMLNFPFGIRVKRN